MASVAFNVLAIGQLASPFVTAYRNTVRVNDPSSSANYPSNAPSGISINAVTGEMAVLVNNGATAQCFIYKTDDPSNVLILVRTLNLSFGAAFLAYSPDGAYLAFGATSATATAPWNNALVVYETTGFTIITRNAGDALQSSVNSVNWNKQGTRIFTAAQVSGQYGVLSWSISGGQLNRQTHVAGNTAIPTQAMTSGAISGDGRWMAFYETSNIQRWSISADGLTVAYVASISAAMGTINRLNGAFNTAGSTNFMVAGSSTPWVRMIDFASGVFLSTAATIPTGIAYATVEDPAGNGGFVAAATPNPTSTMNRYSSTNVFIGTYTVRAAFLTAVDMKLIPAVVQANQPQICTVQ